MTKTQTAEAARVESLREQIREVRNEIVSIVARMEDITLQQIPRIHADYALKIGCWEEALLNAELAGRRARRRLRLAQAQANRGETPQMERIEAQLDAELADWMAKAEAARIAYEQALVFLSCRIPMSPAESQELKRVYRTLVKRLHPDVRAGNDEERAALFLLAQEAYRNGDVDTLRSLEVATRHMDPHDDDLMSTDDADLLERELELAHIEEDVMRERLHQLETCEDMRLGHLLANPEWVTEQTEELRRSVEEWERVRTECDARLRELRGGLHE